MFLGFGFGSTGKGRRRSAKRDAFETSDEKEDER